MRPRPVLLDVPEGLRAGLRPDGQGPGPAGQPAADRRRLRAADVLPEVRAPAVLEAQRECPEARRARSRRRKGTGSVVGHNVPSDTVSGPAGRRTAAVRLPAWRSVCSPRQQHEREYGDGQRPTGPGGCTATRRGVRPGRGRRLASVLASSATQRRHAATGEACLAGCRAGAGRSWRPALRREARQTAERVAPSTDRSPRLVSQRLPRWRLRRAEAALRWPTAATGSSARSSRSRSTTRSPDGERIAMAVIRLPGRRPPDRLPGDQPRRARRLRRPVRAQARPVGSARRCANVRRGRLRPARGRRAAARPLPERAATSTRTSRLDTTPDTPQRASTALEQGHAVRRRLPGRASGRCCRTSAPSTPPGTWTCCAPPSATRADLPRQVLRHLPGRGLRASCSPATSAPWSWTARVDPAISRLKLQHRPGQGLRGRAHAFLARLLSAARLPARQRHRRRRPAPRLDRPAAPDRHSPLKNGAGRRPRRRRGAGRARRR